MLEVEGKAGNAVITKKYSTTKYILKGKIICAVQSIITVADIIKICFKNEVWFKNLTKILLFDIHQQFMVKTDIWVSQK